MPQLAERRATGQQGLTTTSVVIGLAAALVLVWGVISWLSSGSPASGSDGETARSIVGPATRDQRPRAALPEVPSPSLESLELPEQEEAHVPQAPATAARNWAASELPHEEREGNPYRSFVPGEFFEEKYAGASGDDLLDAKARLDVQVGQLNMEATDHFFDSGQAETWVVDADRPLEDEAAPEPRKSYGLLMMSRSRSLDGGSRMLKGKGDLPWADYVSLYDLHDELKWVNLEMWHRVKARKEALIAELGAQGAGK